MAMGAADWRIQDFRLLAGGVQEGVGLAQIAERCQGGRYSCRKVRINQTTSGRKATCCGGLNSYSYSYSSRKTLN